MPPVPDDSQQPTPHADGTAIVARAREMGFALAGITGAEPSEFPRELAAWLGNGKHAGMGWLAENTELRLDPRAMVPGATSVLLVADVYAHAAGDAPPGGSGRVAKYARGDDYHRVMKAKLHELADELRESHPDHQFRAFVDTAPVLEREHASRAGLGWTGKHTLLINPDFGSYFALGGIITTLPLSIPEEQIARWLPVRGTPETGHCGTCTRCIDACPTDAITPWSVDASRCISYLTIEHREPIDESFWAAIGDNLYGCDICQDVCPHNAEPSVAPIRSEYTPRHNSFDLLGVLGWTEDDRRAAFTRSAMKRAKLPMMKRNAIICATNAIAQDPTASDGLRERIGALASDAHEKSIVRETARAALGILGA